MIDLFEEMRAVELDERLATQERGHWSAAELLRRPPPTVTPRSASTTPGAIAVGQRADLVTLDRGGLRTAGTGADEATAVFAASAADVVRVWSTAGRRRATVTADGVGGELDGCRSGR